ncbi:MAG: glycosyltransferase family 4 protein [Cyclobacteriaceae bacterium]
MKILIISNLYPSTPKPKDSSGVMLLHNYAFAWSKEHEIEVINPHSYNLLSAREVKHNLIPKFELDGILVRNETVLRTPAGSLRVSKFEEIAKSESGEYDLMVACLPVGLEIAHFLNQRLGVPYIAYLHNTDFHRSGVSKGKLTTKYAKFLRAAKGLMYVSEKLQKQFERALAPTQSGLFLPGAISQSWFADQPMRTFNWKKRLRLITPARLVKQKNIDTVLTALGQLTELDFKYTIAGDGDHRVELEEHASSNSALSKAVTFTGMLDPVQLKKQIDKNDVLVMLSTNESFGLVYLEAMARGCIPIGTIGEGIDGVIKHGENGFLCSPDSQSLKKLLLEITDLPEAKLEKISKSGIESAKNFTYESLADSFTKFTKSRLADS